MRPNQSGLASIDGAASPVGNVVALSPRCPDLNGDEGSARRFSVAATNALRFLTGPQAEVNTFRISALFEAEPELDGLVGSMIRNGFRYIADLNTARLADVFESSNSRLDERRRVIERLKLQAGVRLVA